MQRIPVTILTGFLGAGKTTLLNRLLTENKGQSFAVIVNEYGDVGIDGALLENAKDGMLEINGGAVCCAAMGDTAQAMSALLSSEKNFSRVIIETTGLADPLPLARAFRNRPSLEQHFILDAIVTVADASSLSARLEDTIEARQQLLAADIVIITKTDLVSAERVNDITSNITNINPQAHLHIADHGYIDPKALLNPSLPPLQKRPSSAIQEHAAHAHTGITSVHLRETNPLSMSKVARFIGEYLVANGDRLLRYKGIFCIEGRNERFVFQGVQFTFTLLPDRPWHADEERKSDLILIGTEITNAEFFEPFHACSA